MTKLVFVEKRDMLFEQNAPDTSPFTEAAFVIHNNTWCNGKWYDASYYPCGQFHSCMKNIMCGLALSGSKWNHNFYLKIVAKGQWNNLDQQCLWACTFVSYLIHMITVSGRHISSYEISFIIACLITITVIAEINCWYGKIILSLVIFLILELFQCKDTILPA